MSDRWPAMMTKETAAAYCDMSVGAFTDQCPVQPIDQGWRGLRWKKAKLDAWIDALPEKAPKHGAPKTLDAPTQPANDAEAAEQRRRRSLERI
jgi:hypothetical protein